MGIAAARFRPVEYSPSLMPLNSVTAADTVISMVIARNSGSLNKPAYTLPTVLPP